MDTEIAQPIVISRMPLPTVVSLQADKDEKVEALVAMISDCSAYVAGDLSFLDVLQSFICFTQTVDASRGNANADTAFYPIS